MKAFGAWCEVNGRILLPATAATLAEYVRHLTVTPGRRGTPRSPRLPALGFPHTKPAPPDRGM
ncbi:hypothetical protein AB0F17_59850 [Nonomuraea sp. NPDC026600]|uniref:hypothetical protein n=1 Tax=Nonomuraea sp. NPDC026600 TaxID=3155363 RepID=UPI0033DE35FF